MFGFLCFIFYNYFIIRLPNFKNYENTLKRLQFRQNFLFSAKSLQSPETRPQGFALLIAEEYKKVLLGINRKLKGKSQQRLPKSSASQPLLRSPLKSS
jgi:hypothetical protein